MVAVAWTAIGLLAATLATTIAAILHLGARIDALSARVDGLSGRIDGLAARLDAHIQPHAG